MRKEEDGDAKMGKSGVETMREKRIGFVFFVDQKIKIKIQ